MIVLPALSSVNDILDTDLVFVEHSTGEGFKMTGADLKNIMKAQALEVCPKFPDYSKPINIGPEGVLVYSWNATKDCFVQFVYWADGTDPLHLLINHHIVSVCDTNNGTVSQFSGYIKKGDNIIFSNDGNINRSNILRLFELQS